MPLPPTAPTWLVHFAARSFLLHARMPFPSFARFQCSTNWSLWLTGHSLPTIFVATKQTHSNAPRLQVYTGGDSCGGSIGPRRAKAKFVCDPLAVQSVAISNVEFPTCFYTLTVKSAGAW